MKKEEGSIPSGNDSWYCPDIVCRVTAFRSWKGPWPHISGEHPWFLHLNMGVTAILKIHSKTLSTDREAPLQVSDLEDLARSSAPLTVLASPGTQQPTARYIKARLKVSWPLNLQAHSFLEGETVKTAASAVLMGL